MDLNVEIPFIEKSKIKKEADKIRAKAGVEGIPVNIEKIVELHFRINIIPKPNMQNDCDVDALIISDWNNIIVDKRMYDDERYQTRLRFSLAHELGHFILHKKIWEKFNLKGVSDYEEFIEKIDINKYGALETQADMFANNILVPRATLRGKRVEVISKIDKKDVDKIDKETLNEYIAIPLAKYFKVHETTIKIALDSLES